MTGWTNQMVSFFRHCFVNLSVVKDMLSLRSVELQMEHNDNSLLFFLEIF